MSHLWMAISAVGETRVTTVTSLAIHLLNKPFQGRFIPFSSLPSTIFHSLAITTTEGGCLRVCSAVVLSKNITGVCLVASKFWKFLQECFNDVLSSGLPIHYSLAVTRTERARVCGFVGSLDCSKKIFTKLEDFFQDSDITKVPRDGLRGKATPGTR